MPALIVSQVISSGLGLLEEPADVPVRVGLDQPVRRRVVDRRQHDGGLGPTLPVQAQDRGQIDLRQDVPVEHDDRIGQRLARIPDRSTRAERRRLDDVADLDAGIAAITEHLLDAAWLVIEAEDHLVDVGHLLQQVDLVVKEWPLENRDDRLRRVQRERAQARAFAPGEQDGLHATADHTRCLRDGTCRAANPAAPSPSARTRGNSRARR